MNFCGRLVVIVLKWAARLGGGDDLGVATGTVSREMRPLGLDEFEGELAPHVRRQWRVHSVRI